MDIMMILEGQAHLPQVILALGTARRFAGCLDSREEQGDQDADNGDDDQQLDEREGASARQRGKWFSEHSSMFSLEQAQQICRDLAAA